MKEYKYLIRCNHPVLKRLDFTVYTISRVIEVMTKFLDIGYEINVERVIKCSGNNVTFDGDN